MVEAFEVTSPSKIFLRLSATIRNASRTIATMTSFETIAEAATKKDANVEKTLPGLAAMVADDTGIVCH